jgi:hypothetical protein
MVDEVIRSYCNLPWDYDVEKWLETAPGRRHGLGALWSREEVDIDRGKKKAYVYPDFYAAKMRDAELLRSIYKRGCPGTDILLRDVLVNELRVDELRASMCIDEWFSNQRLELKY